MYAICVLIENVDSYKSYFLPSTTAAQMYDAIRDLFRSMGGTGGASRLMREMAICPGALGLDGMEIWWNQNCGCSVNTAANMLVGYDGHSRSVVGPALAITHETAPIDCTFPSLRRFLDTRVGRITTVIATAKLGTGPRTGQSASLPRPRALAPARKRHLVGTRSTDSRLPFGSSTDTFLPRGRVESAEISQSPRPKTGELGQMGNTWFEPAYSPEAAIDLPRSGADDDDDSDEQDPAPDTRKDSPVAARRDTVVLRGRAKVYWESGDMVNGDAEVPLTMAKVIQSPDDSHTGVALRESTTQRITIVQKTPIGGSKRVRESEDESEDQEKPKEEEEGEKEDDQDADPLGTASSIPVPPSMQVQQHHRYTSSVVAPIPPVRVVKVRAPQIMSRPGFRSRVALARTKSVPRSSQSVPYRPRANTPVPATPMPVLRAPRKSRRLAKVKPEIDVPQFTKIPTRRKRT